MVIFTLPNETRTLISYLKIKRNRNQIRRREFKKLLVSKNTVYERQYLKLAYFPNTILPLSHTNKLSSSSRAFVLLCPPNTSPRRFRCIYPIKQKFKNEYSSYKCMGKSISHAPAPEAHFMMFFLSQLSTKPPVPAHSYNYASVDTSEFDKKIPIE